MKPVYVLIIYIIGFIIFYKAMNFLYVDKIIFGIFGLNNDKPKANSEDLLTPTDSSKPLKLTKQEIGRHTWALLHSMAASYPTVPTEKDKKLMEDFLFGLAVHYPCKICGTHLLKMLKKHGVKHGSRDELINYMCDIHNIVNKVLNKEKFDCSKAKDVWGGDCGCDV